MRRPGKPGARTLPALRARPWLLAGMIGNHHPGIHGPGRGRGYGPDVQPGLLQEPVQHAPGERAMGAASLKRKVDEL